MQDVPIYINCRDRLTHLRQLVAWLEKAGHQQIILLDNASTYPPLLEYYEQSPHQIVHLGANVGPTALWDRRLLPAGQRYVYTDPDIIPIEACPSDLVAHLGELLDRHPEKLKAGPGLFIADLPDDHPIYEHEKSFYGAPIEEGVFSAPIDTTFALYRADGWFDLDPSIRCGYPYQARHMPWYITERDEETSYYLDHAGYGRAGTNLCNWGL